MARGTRVDAPGAFHHVMVRGIEGREIYLDDVDRDHFLACLRRAAADAGARFGASALMPNHVHLLIRSGVRPLSALMQRLGTRYVRYFNKRHERRGYLFQGRYKSLLVEDDAYLLVLIRYIHANPLRAGLVGSLDELASYPWTGHAALMGQRYEPLQLVDDVLARFGADVHEARRGLVAWMSAAGESEHDGASLPEAPGLERVLVVDRPPLHRDARLVAPSERAAAHLAELSAPEARIANAVRRYGSLEELIDQVCTALNADPQQVRGGRKSRSEFRARAAIASIARRQMGLPYTTIAPAVGVTVGALYRMESRGAVIAREAGFTPTEKER